MAKKKPSKLVGGLASGAGAVAAWQVVEQSMIPPYSSNYWFAIFLGGIVGYLVVQLVLDLLS